MKIYFYRKQMLYIIYSISILIFSLAYNACYRTSYEGTKDVDCLSDNYYIISFPEEKLNMESLNEWKNNDFCRYIFVCFEWSQGKATTFSEEFLESMGIEKSCKDFDIEENVVLVNSDALDMCYTVNGELYLDIQGIAYRVIATYDEEKDDKINETLYYLNQNAKGLEKNKGYDYVLLDPVSEKKSSEMISSFKEKNSAIDVSKWSGKTSGSMDNRQYLVLVTLICASILCINCVGYSDEWIKGQMQELGIRKLVGATEFQNTLLILKRFVIVFILSYLTGIFLAALVLYGIKIVPALQATRNLFGTYLYCKSALTAGVSVFVIGILMTIFSRILLKRKNILVSIRGRV